MSEQEIKCPECGGDTYWYYFNGRRGDKCRECGWDQYDDGFTDEQREKIGIAVLKMIEKKGGQP